MLKGRSKGNPARISGIQKSTLRRAQPAVWLPCSLGRRLTNLFWHLAVKFTLGEKGPVVIPSHIRYQGHWETLALTWLRPELKTTKTIQVQQQGSFIPAGFSCNTFVSLGSSEARVLLVPEAWHLTQLDSQVDIHSFAFLHGGALLLAIWAQSRLFSCVFHLWEPGWALVAWSLATPSSLGNKAGSDKCLPRSGSLLNNTRLFIFFLTCCWLPIAL